jgi:hypothetical protein
MESVIISLPDQLSGKIKEAANKIGVSPKEFIKSGVEEKLLLLDSDFQNAIEHVLNKNVELYRRLA